MKEKLSDTLKPVTKQKLPKHTQGVLDKKHAEARAFIKTLDINKLKAVLQ